MREASMPKRSFDLRHAGGAIALALCLALSGTAMAKQKEPARPPARQQILDLISLYSYTFDGKDLEAFVPLFTEDVHWAWYGPDDVLLIDLHSPEELREFFGNTIQSHIEAGRQTRHYQTNTVFTELSGRHAATRTLVLIVWQTEGQPLPVATRSGYYDDTFVKTPDGWKFQERVLHTDQ
jgi:hypothetical protein